jgi:hypothetical protein
MKNIWSVQHRANQNLEIKRSLTILWVTHSWSNLVYQRYKFEGLNLQIDSNLINIRNPPTKALKKWGLPMLYTTNLLNCAKHAIYNMFSRRKTEPQGNNSKHLKAKKLDKQNYITLQHIQCLTIVYMHEFISWERN